MRIQLYIHQQDRKINFIQIAPQNISFLTVNQVEISNNNNNNKYNIIQAL